GGIIGVIIACILFARKYGVNYLYLFDLCSIAGPIGIFFGRIANFINGELVGRPSDPNFPLAVKFPQDLFN
ncbi:prolipoprotein diacylglyceryl transferase, partial [Vibrio cholerae]|nr:prolipoprotein diacylglyceryl transferase [Vibrio cholerae]